MANIVTLTQDELSVYDLSIKTKQERHQSVTKDSLMLVRACDNFPYNHCLLSKKNSGFAETIPENNFPYRNIFYTGELLYPKYKVNKNTIHFTINGLIYN